MFPRLSHRALVCVSARVPRSPSRTYGVHTSSRLVPRCTAARHETHHGHVLLRHAMEHGYHERPTGTIHSHLAHLPPRPFFLFLPSFLFLFPPPPPSHVLFSPVFSSRSSSRSNDRTIIFLSKLIASCAPSSTIHPSSTAIPVLRLAATPSDGQVARPFLSLVLFSSLLCLSFFFLGREGNSAFHKLATGGAQEEEGRR